MKAVKLLAAVAMVVAAGAASAGDWYGSIGFDQKDKLNSKTNEFHNVTSMTIGNKLGNGFSVEALVEEELVKNPSSGSYADEGLYQLRANKSFETGTIFTPYVGLAVGEKNKATLSFPIYRYDIGTTVKITDQIGAKLNWRHRQAFDAHVNNTATKYDTDETRIGLFYKLTAADTITVSYAQERNKDGLSSEYNTTAISYSRSF
jgi:opacity protein-like surface antigen